MLHRGVSSPKSRPPWSVSFALDLAQEPVRWQGAFFSGSDKTSFGSDWAVMRDTYELMNEVRRRYPRAFSLERDNHLLAGHLPDVKEFAQLAESGQGTGDAPYHGDSQRGRRDRTYRGGFLRPRTVWDRFRPSALRRLSRRRHDPGGGRTNTPRPGSFASRIRDERSR